MRNRLTVIRAEKKISQAELAKMAGISRATLSDIENEKTCPDAITIAKLVKALGIPANLIFFDFGVVN
jgi:putative transcriptional regulator